MLAPRFLVNQLLRPYLRRGEGAAFHLPGLLAEGGRALALDTGDLAELVFHLPLLQGLRRSCPALALDILLPQEHVPLAVGTGLFQRCLVVAPKQLRPLRLGFLTLLRELRTGDYRAAFVLHHDPSPVHELLALGSGAALRLGPSHPGGPPAINFEVRPADRRGYRGARPAAAAAFLGAPRAAAAQRWPLPEDKLRQARQLVRLTKPRPDELLVGIDPSPGKTGAALALGNLHFLVHQVAAHVPCQVLGLAPPAQADRLREFEAGLRVRLSSLPREDLLQTALLLAQCDLLLAANTDLFHLAAALDVPCVGLFLESDGPEWVPSGRPRATVLRVNRGERVEIDALLEAVARVRGAAPADAGRLGALAAAAGGDAGRGPAERS